MKVVGQFLSSWCSSLDNLYTMSSTIAIVQGHGAHYILRPYGRAADPGAIRGTFRSKASWTPPQITPQIPQPRAFWCQKSPGASNVDPWGVQDTPTGSQGRPKSSHLEPKVGQGTPQSAQRTSDGTLWATLGPLWAPFGRPLGTFGVTLNTFGRHCGHFLRKAAELSKTKEFLGNP